MQRGCGKILLLNTALCIEVGWILRLVGRHLQTDRQMDKRGCPFISIEAGDQVIGMVDSDAGSPQLRSLSRASSKNRKKGVDLDEIHSIQMWQGSTGSGPTGGRLERQLAEMRRLGMDEMHERVDGLFIYSTASLIICL